MTSHAGLVAASLAARAAAVTAAPAEVSLVVFAGSALAYDLKSRRRS
ncbi:hypothetical protein [Caudoviricetes sp.]|nr:hypothetical protein [Caudoviricetes sp.]